MTELDKIEMQADMTESDKIEMQADTINRIDRKIGAVEDLE